MKPGECVKYGIMCSKAVIAGEITACRRSWWCDAGSYGYCKLSSVLNTETLPQRGSYTHLSQYPSLQRSVHWALSRHAASTWCPVVLSVSTEGNALIRTIRSCATSERLSLLVHEAGGTRLPPAEQWITSVQNGSVNYNLWLVQRIKTGFKGLFLNTLPHSLHSAMWM